MLFSSTWSKVRLVLPFNVLRYGLTWWSLFSVQNNHLQNDATVHRVLGMFHLAFCLLPFIFIVKFYLFFYAIENITTFIEGFYNHYCLLPVSFEVKEEFLGLLEIVDCSKGCGGIFSKRQNRYLRVKKFFGWCQYLEQWNFMVAKEITTWSTTFKICELQELQIGSCLGSHHKNEHLL